MKPHQKKAQKRLDREAKADAHRASQNAALARKRATAKALRSSRTIRAPDFVKDVVRAQLKLFEARFGRAPRDTEPLFYDPREPVERGPVPLPGTAEDVIAEVAAELGAQASLVAVLVRSGLVVRGAPTADAAPPPQEG